MGYNRSVASSVTQSVNRQQVAKEVLENPVQKFDYADSLDVADWQVNVDQDLYKLLKNSDTGYIRTTNAYNINKSLREKNGTTLSPGSQETVKLLDKSIAAASAPENLLTDRYVNSGFLAQFGIKLEDTEDSRKQVVDVMRNLIGTTYLDKGYTSVSLRPDQNVFTESPIKLIIEVPKGTPAYISGNLSESEMILGRNSAFKILQVKDVSGQVEILLRVVN